MIRKFKPERWIPLTALVLLTGATIHMSVRGSSHMSEIAWIPDWLGAWADRNPDLRTAVPFFILSLISPSAAAKASGEKRQRIQPDPLCLVLTYVLIALLLLVTEGSQYFIDTRVLNIADIGWGMVGLGAGAVIGILTFWHAGKLIPLPLGKAQVSENV